jgi:polyisoprenoid-binding protein YceI
VNGWGRNRWIAIAVVAVVAIVAVGYAVFASLAGGGPAAVNLSPGPTADCTPTTGGSTTPGSSSLDGTWRISGSDSFVGYRVREQLSILPAPSDAVGRTTAVDGDLTISGLQITAVDVTADLSKLTSDKSMRDERIRTMGLETDAFPQAEFVLTSPIGFASQPAEGETVSAAAEGELTLHGVTNAICMPVQASWTNGSIRVLGSVGINFADHQIDPPNSGFVSVQDHGTIEFQLNFVPA